MKKFIITLFSFVSVLCLSLCVIVGAGCGETSSGNSSKPGSFKDFTNETVTAYYGDFFSLDDYAKVYDDKGNLYSVKAAVKDSKGNQVDLLQNKFKITDITGYTIELSILDENDGKVLKTRTVTVNTKDYDAPYITLGNLTTNATENEKVTFPLWFDSKDENFTSAVEVTKLYYDSEMQDYDETSDKNVAFTVEYSSRAESAAFNVGSAGRYKVSALAWNGLSERTQDTFVREKSFYVDVIPEPAVNAIETFDTASSKSAAYGSNRNSMNPTAKWHEEFQGKQGIIELKKSEFKNITWGKQSVNLHCFNLKSSFRDSSFYAENESWDYISVILFVKSEKETAQVCCSGYPDGSQVVKTNEWQELKIEKKWAQFFSEGGDRNQTTLANWLSKDGGKCSWWGFLSIVADETEDITLYVDRIAYDNEMVISTTENVTVGDEVTISTKVGEVTEGFIYTVKYPFAKEETQVTNGKFIANKSGAYVITAKGTVYGFYRSESITVNIVAANEIEGFNSAESIVSAVGLNKNGVFSKKEVVSNAEWLETFNDKNGVLKFTSIKYDADNKTHEYFIKSSFRDESFYLTEEWDYISVIIYIEGNANEQVTIGHSRFMAGSETVNCNEWIEFKISKATAVNMVNGRNMENFASKMSASGTKDSWLHALVAISGEQNSPKTIYLDSISYEKNS